MSHTESVTPPTIRVRISHDKTAKGWRCNETTVEITAPANDGTWSIGAVQGLASAYLHVTHELGLEEANRRNQVEGFST